MTEKLIQILINELKAGKHLYYVAQEGVASRVTSITSPPLTADNGESIEPSEVAWIGNGQYVALYNASINDFKIMTDIKIN